MRTTVTLDPDVEALVKRAMREHGKTFKEAVNDAIRDGLGRRGRTSFRTPTFHAGRPLVNLDKALQLAGALDDEELVAKMRLGK